MPWALPRTTCQPGIGSAYNSRLGGGPTSPPNGSLRAHLFPNLNPTPHSFLLSTQSRVVELRDPSVSARHSQRPLPLLPRTTIQASTGHIPTLPPIGRLVHVPSHNRIASHVAASSDFSRPSSDLDLDLARGCRAPPNSTQTTPPRLLRIPSSLLPSRPLSLSRVSGLWASPTNAIDRAFRAGSTRQTAHSTVPRLKARYMAQAWPGRQDVMCQPDSLQAMPDLGPCRAGPSAIYSWLQCKATTSIIYS